MDIHIRQGESLVILAKDGDNNERILQISYREMIDRGEVLKDGLTGTEIAFLCNRKKIQALKNYRARTNAPFIKAKKTIEGWVERNQCCVKWPYCEHIESINSLDLEKLIFHSKDKCVIWSYPAILTIDQAGALMSLVGSSHIKYGLFSFEVRGGITVWASNASIEE